MLSKWILAGAIVTLGAGIALGLSQPMPAKAADAPGADVAHGKRLFTSMGCYQCHGYVGQGASSTGPALVPLRRDAESFLQYLRSPTGVMPAFSAKILPDADARDILGYIRSLPPARPPETIALLAPYVRHGGAAAPAKPSPAAATAIAEGGKLFATNCAMCHGAELQGGIGPSLRGVGGKYSIDQIAAVITNPPPAMPKLTPAPLGAAQVTQIATFLHEKH